MIDPLIAAVSAGLAIVCLCACVITVRVCCKKRTAAKPMVPPLRPSLSRRGTSSRSLSKQEVRLQKDSLVRSKYEPEDRAGFDGVEGPVYDKTPSRGRRSSTVSISVAPPPPPPPPPQAPPPMGKLAKSLENVLGDDDL